MIDKTSIASLLVGMVALQLVWNITDFLSVKERLKTLRDRKLYILQIGVLFPQFISGIYFPWPHTSHDSFFTVFGLIMFYAGVSLCIWAKLVMKTSWGMPAQHDINRQDKLITAGPFSYTRNPIYVGLILVAAGMSVTLHSWFIFLVYFLYVYIKKAITTEESLLEKHFGEEYNRYKQKVPRFI